MNANRRHSSPAALAHAFRLEGRGRRFGDPRIEARFRGWRRLQMLPYVRMGCAAALAICLLGVSFVAAAMPQYLVRALLLVSLLALPLILLTLWISQRPRLRRLLEPVTTACGALTALGAVWLCDASVDLPGAASAVITFIAFFSFALRRLPTLAAFVTLLPGTAYALMLAHADHQAGLLSREALAFCVFLPLAALITGALASLELELRLHQGFRNELLIKAQRRALRDERAQLSRFLAPAVSRRVHKHGIAAALELRTLMLTTVCCDLRGFTRFTEAHGPQRMARVLDDYYATVIEAAAAHGAMVKDFIGDGALLLVGAPHARADHARAGVALARELCSRIGALARRHSEAGTPLGIGVGVATGLCAVGAIGSHRQLEYAAVGSAVNLASRLCACAGDGEVLLSAPTLSMARLASDPPLQSRALQLKGFDAPIHATPAPRGSDAVAAS